MDKMKELMTTTDLVKRILEERPEARCSDNILYFFVCGIIAKEKGLDMDKISMTKFLLNMKECGFPQFESVRRTRQKIQEKNPCLSADSRVEAHRMMNENTFREYARSEL